MEDNRNFMIAIGLTLVILLGYTYFYDAPRQEALEQARLEQQKVEAAQKGDELPDLNSGDAAPGNLANPSADGGMQISATREELISNRDKVLIKSPRLHGSIALKGGRLDDLTLADYKVSLEEGAEDVALLSPEGSKKAYFVDLNWGVEGSKAPTADTVWTADQDTLEAGGAVTLSWDNGEGLLFTRTITLDENYMFGVSQKVTNSSDSAVKVAQYGRVVRKGRPEGQALYILHEGPMWSLDEGIEEYSYGDLEDMGPKDKITASGTDGGWVGITDKYWLVALIPDAKKDFNVEVYRRGNETSENFYANYFHNWTVLPAGESYVETSRLFAGAKEVSLLDYYTDIENVKMLNYAIDWGMFYFLTKPIFYLLEILYGLVGNFGIAILLLTALVKLALFPIANKGYKSMNKMKVLQPKMQALKEKYGDDRAKMQQATMELYKKEKVNPVSGCLPMFLQFPVFFALYKVLYVTIDMRHAPFFGWIKDLSAPDTMLVTNLFGLIPWEPTGFLALGILPVIMGFTMWLQMQMTPSSGDPMQRKIMLFMPIVFTFMLSQFSVGLVIYWTCSNILGILQQWVLMRRADPVPTADKKA
ncbi:membrane protein insertase YidC [Paremcibacter congregatus]|uniref:membrane protein insertase YidC n=1 Tax=Paremcibacter congregatus TaxID=2043170 RepID=UPI0030EF62EE|tara:strand:- start:15205 stop:16974 length:1770 start_codon:yes stop_codon:yes gene_type:complete